MGVIVIGTNGSVLLAKPAVVLAQGTADERAVAKVIAGRQLAWNTGDVEGYARLLTLDADLSSSSGQIARGREAVIALYVKVRWRVCRRDHIDECGSDQDAQAGHRYPLVMRARAITCR